MIDKLTAAGNVGLSAQAIAQAIWPNETIERDGKRVHTVRSMRFQINEHFAENGSKQRVTTNRERFFLSGTPPAWLYDGDGS